MKIINMKQMLNYKNIKINKNLKKKKIYLILCFQLKKIQWKIIRNKEVLI